MDWLIRYLKGIDTWKKVQIYATLLAVSLIGYGAYQVLMVEVDYMQSKAFKHDVKINMEQRRQCAEIVDNFVSNNDVSVCIVNVFQPKDLPKVRSELIYARQGNLEFEEFLSHPIIESERSIHEAPELFYELTKAEFIEVADTDDNYLGYYMQAIEAKRGQVFGLYKYGVLYGSIMIAYPEEVPSGKEFIRNKFTMVRSVNEVLF